jgi:hypothetical protein
MKIVNKIQGKTTTYDDIEVGDVFKFDGTICIAVNDDIILRHNSEIDEWNVAFAPSGDAEITLLDCELVIKGEK